MAIQAAPDAKSVNRREFKFMIKFAIATTALLIPFLCKSQTSTAEELRKVQNELRQIKRDQEMESLRSRLSTDEVADELRRIRMIEEQKLRDQQRIQKESERAEQVQKVEEHYTNLARTAAELEVQVSQGNPLSTDQLQWIRANGAALKARLESSDTLMLMEFIRETEQGFTGVSGTLPMSKSQANAAKQRILRDQSLFQRFAEINRAHIALTSSVDQVDELHHEEKLQIVPGPIPNNLRPKQSAASEVEARKRALIEKMQR